MKLYLKILKHQVQFSILNKQIFYKPSASRVKQALQSPTATKATPCPPRLRPGASPTSGPAPGPPLAPTYRYHCSSSVWLWLMLGSTSVPCPPSAHRGPAGSRGPRRQGAGHPCPQQPAPASVVPPLCRPRCRQSQGPDLYMMTKAFVFLNTALFQIQPCFKSCFKKKT